MPDIKHLRQRWGILILPPALHLQCVYFISPIIYPGIRGPLPHPGLPPHPAYSLAVSNLGNDPGVCAIHNNRDVFHILRVPFCVLARLSACLLLSPRTVTPLTRPKTAGNTISVSTVVETIPPTMGVAMCRVNSEPVPVLNMTGSNPTTLPEMVIITGRIRYTAPW